MSEGTPEEQNEEQNDQSTGSSNEQQEKLMKMLELFGSVMQMDNSTSDSDVDRIIDQIDEVAEIEGSSKEKNKLADFRELIESSREELVLPQSDPFSYAERCIEVALEFGEEYLELEGLELERLPDSLGELHQLKQLVINDTQLQSLPESIGRLTNLEKLEVYDSQLTSLPESIGNLRNLKYLTLFNNQLKSLPESIGQLSNLKELNLVNNQLDHLPESICDLKKITSLELRENHFQTLPEFISQMQSLRSLYLSQNRLGTVPSSVYQLKDLNTLELVETYLTELPEEIGELTHLRNLNLSSNPLTELPASLLKLTALEELWLFGNDQLQIPEKYLESRPATILKYYFQNNQSGAGLNADELEEQIAPDIHYGIFDDNGNYIDLHVQASVSQTAEALQEMLKVKSWHQQVQDSEMELKENGCCLVRLKGLDWTLIAGAGRREARVNLQQLSGLLKTKAIEFCFSDTADAIDYQLYESGELKEHLASVEGHIGFESKLRKLELPTLAELRQKLNEEEDWEEEDEDWDEDDENWNEDGEDACSLVDEFLNTQQLKVGYLYRFAFSSIENIIKICQRENWEIERFDYLELED